MDPGKYPAPTYADRCGLVHQREAGDVAGREAGDMVGQEAGDAAGCSERGDIKWGSDMEKITPSVSHWSEGGGW